MGDHMTGMAAAGAVAAALFVRERTGQGQLVSTSLLRIGQYMLGWDNSINLRTGLPTVPITRRTAPNPLILDYGAGDGCRFWLLGLQGDRHWPNVLRAVGRPDLADDPASPPSWIAPSTPPRWCRSWRAISHPDARTEWADDLRPGGRVVGAGAGRPRFIDDPQARCRLLRRCPGPTAAPRAMVATPVDFSATPWEPGAAVPETGQHTEEVLLELGYDWDRILALKEANAIT